MIELRANIPEAEWRDGFPPPAELPTGLSESAWRDRGAPLSSQLVTMRHADFPNAIWNLRLLEKIATDKDATTGSYQTGMTWSKTMDGWHFSDCPVAGLDGTIQGMVSASHDTVEFSLTMTNQSAETWSRALAWICFNHSQAKHYYQYHNFVSRDGELVQTPPDLEEHYCLPGHQRNWWFQGAIEPTESLIATSCRDDEGNAFAAGIGASRAILLGQNPIWPCTDIGLFFGDVSPGQQASIEGRVYFSYGSPMEILKRYRQDFSYR